MKRLIAVVVAAVLGVILLSPPSYAGRYDPHNPPIPVDRQPNLDQPSGDDTPWGDPQAMNAPPRNPYHFVLRSFIWSTITVFWPVQEITGVGEKIEDPSNNAEQVRHKVQ